MPQIKAPSSAPIGGNVIVHASGLKHGTYALVLIADHAPIDGTSCVARLSHLASTSSGRLVLRGMIPRKLKCYQGLSTLIAAVATPTGPYHLAVCDPIAPAGFSAAFSFVRAPLLVSH